MDDLQRGTQRQRQGRGAVRSGQPIAGQSCLALAERRQRAVGLALEAALGDEHGFAVAEQRDAGLEAGGDHGPRHRTRGVSGDVRPARFGPLRPGPSIASTRILRA